MGRGKGHNSLDLHILLHLHNLQYVEDSQDHTRGCILEAPQDPH